MVGGDLIVTTAFTDVFPNPVRHNDMKVVGHACPFECCPVYVCHLSGLYANDAVGLSGSTRGCCAEERFATGIETVSALTAETVYPPIWHLPKDNRAYFTGSWSAQCPVMGSVM